MYKDKKKCSTKAYSHLQETGHTVPSVAETEVLLNQKSFLGQVAEAAIQRQNSMDALPAAQQTASKH